LLAPAQDVAKGAAAHLPLRVSQLDHDVAAAVQANVSDRAVEVVLAEDLVAGRDGERPGGFGVYAEGAVAQTAWVDRSQLRGVKRDGDDLLTTVERAPVEGEPHASARTAAGVGDAGHRHSRGGRTGGKHGTTGDRRCHVDSFVSDLGLDATC
jgi:hypothetical protein